MRVQDPIRLLLAAGCQDSTIPGFKDSEIRDSEMRDVNDQGFRRLLPTRLCSKMLMLQPGGFHA